MESISNKVAQSELVVFSLEEFWDGRPVVEFDIAPFLYEGLILREKTFREALEEVLWESYENKYVAIRCSTDAIIPTWAFMLIASKLNGIAADVRYGTEREVRAACFDAILANIDWETYRDRPVIVKGCSSEVVPLSAYVSVVQHLQQVARKIMFGEPCSTVPVWRRPKS